MVTLQFRNTEMMCNARMKMDAEVSCGIRRDSHPYTTDSLSVRRMMSLFLRMDGMVRKGRMAAMASRVDDLQP